MGDPYMDTFKRLEDYKLDLINIINLLPGHVFLKDKHGRYLWCNNQQIKSLKFTSQEDII